MPSTFNRTYAQPIFKKEMGCSFAILCEKEHHQSQKLMWSVNPRELISVAKQLSLMEISQALEKDAVFQFCVSETEEVFWSVNLGISCFTVARRHLSVSHHNFHFLYHFPIGLPFSLSFPYLFAFSIIILFSLVFPMTSRSPIIISIFFLISWPLCIPSSFSCSFLFLLTFPIVSHRHFHFHHFLSVLPIIIFISIFILINRCSGKSKGHICCSSSGIFHDIRPLRESFGPKVGSQ